MKGVCTKRPGEAGTGLDDVCGGARSCHLVHQYIHTYLYRQTTRVTVTHLRALRMALDRHVDPAGSSRCGQRVVRRTRHSLWHVVGLPCFWWHTTGVRPRIAATGIAFHVARFLFSLSLFSCFLIRRRAPPPPARARRRGGSSGASHRRAQRALGRGRPGAPPAMAAAAAAAPRRCPSPPTYS
jgi:hypothetical protein